MQNIYINWFDKHDNLVMKHSESNSSQYGLPTLGKKFPLMRMGNLAPGSDRARPSVWAPIDINGFFLANVSGGRGKQLF